MNLFDSTRTPSRFAVEIPLNLAPHALTWVIPKLKSLIGSCLLTLHFSSSLSFYHVFCCWEAKCRLACLASTQYRCVVVVVVGAVWESSIWVTFSLVPWDDLWWPLKATAEIKPGHQLWLCRRRDISKYPSRKTEAYQFLGGFVRVFIVECNAKWKCEI